MSKRYQIIDTKTGEIKGDADNLFPDPMTDEGYRFPAHKLGARMFADVDFPKGMSDLEIGKMARLARYHMIAATNMLGYRQSGRIESYTSPEIAELVGYTDRQGRRFMARMLQLRVMRRWQSDGQSQYYINPAYFIANGKRLTLDLFMHFQDELQPLLPPEIMQEFLRQARDKAVLKSDANAEAERIVNHGS
ncbi:MAG: hypothetical protein PHE55_20970 [Methylococcaceae bacterium]|nr:hypothetical protein [Methylococcaceae bacterium]